MKCPQPQRKPKFPENSTPLSQKLKPIEIEVKFYVPFENEIEKQKFLRENRNKINAQTLENRLESKPIKLIYSSPKSRTSTQLLLEIKTARENFYGLQDGSHQVFMEFEKPLEEGHLPVHALFWIDKNEPIDVYVPVPNRVMFGFYPPALKNKSDKTETVEFIFYLSPFENEEQREHFLAQVKQEGKNIKMIESRSKVFTIDYYPYGIEQSFQLIK